MKEHKHAAVLRAIADGICLHAASELCRLAAVEAELEAQAIIRTPLECLASAPPAPQADRSGCTAGTDEECKHRHCATHCPKQAQQAKPQPLSDEQIDEEWFEVHHLSINNAAKARLFARAILAMKEQT